ncbi:two-component sensor histidine kinase [Phytohabitans aurantiacus]|uniref:histidine kinase n=1 Tax=Phytohabitans aurantiacus TaxID=3016789 RepID=A0ABQ5QUP4_9ACTN|nr:two-component sensor histidine kinase [Phytohabitans aurantiacus]
MSIIVWRRRRGDLALAAAVLFAQSVPFLFDPEPWQLAGYLPVVGSALPLVFRRKAPLLCLLLTELCVGAYDLIGTGPAQPVWYGALVGLYTVADLAPKWHRVAALAITAIGLTATVGAPATAARELLTWSAAYALGALTRGRRELARANARQAAELAAARERARIAADLHDILGHAFSMMVVQAEAGAAVAQRDPERAGTAFDAIATAGRDAMRQLRQAVGTLKDRPPPGLANLGDLVGQAELAGLHVRVRSSGTPRELPTDVQLAAYRMVQEALTNVVKHAQAGTVELRTGWTGGGFRLSVADDGVGSARPAAGGHGLSGMRERIAAAGGEVTVGTGLHGKGFKVEAVFP